MKEVEVASLGLDKSSNTPVVILQESGGEKLLPIWIGPGEASAIAMELAGIKFSRPLTHDLFSTVMKGLGGQLVRVLITKVVDNTYYASLVVEKNEEVFSIDARPSDSIALALRAEAPIFAEEELLELTSLDVEEASVDEADDTWGSGWTPPEEDAPSGGAEPPAEASGSGEEQEEGESLREYLRRMNPEDFGRFDL